MIDCDEIRVRPLEDGSWNWFGVSEKDETPGPGFTDRAPAIAAAREEGGAEVLEIKRASGLTETVISPALCRIVLQRVDGSEVGELDPPPGDGGTAIQVTLQPVTSHEEAVTDV